MYGFNFLNGTTKPSFLNRQRQYWDASLSKRTPAYCSVTRKTLHGARRPRSGPPQYSILNHPRHPRSSYFCGLNTSFISTGWADTRVFGNWERHLDSLASNYGTDSLTAILYPKEFEKCFDLKPLLPNTDFFSSENRENHSSLRVQRALDSPEWKFERFWAFQVKCFHSGHN